MSLAAIYQLNGADIPGNFAETLPILKQKISALVGAGTAGEADGQPFGVELYAKCSTDFRKQLGFSVGVCLTNGGKRNADGIAQVIIVSAPPRNIRVEQLTECCRGPGDGMNAVGDRADIVRRKHSTGDFTVTHGHAVYVSGETECQVCHVQGVALPGFGFIEQSDLFASENLSDQAARELIVSGGNWSVRCKDAHVAHAIDVELLQTARKALFQPSFEQPEREQRRVAFIHVIDFDLAGVELLKKKEASQP